MTPANYKLTIYRNIDLALTFTFTRTDGSAFPLTGYTVHATVAREKGGTAITTLGAAINSPASAGVISLSLTAAQTLALPLGNDFVWDLVLVDGSNVRTGPYISGRVQILNVVS